ncbi:MAG: PilZ domain-containing protein [Gemmataceae bacterium]
MNSELLQEVANTVLRKAQQQGYVRTREIRDELARVGLDEKLWESVLSLIQPCVRLRQGRYYLKSNRAVKLRDRVRKELHQQQAIKAAVRQLIQQYRAGNVVVERRGRNRIELIQPIFVETEDRRVLRLLSRDISLTGMRLLGTHRLQGQKVRVAIPRPSEGDVSFQFLLQILWSAEVGDNLYESGGLFLDMDPNPIPRPRIVSED